MQKKTLIIKFRATQNDRDILEQVCRIKSCNKSQILRQAIQDLAQKNNLAQEKHH